MPIPQSLWGRYPVPCQEETHHIVVDAAGIDVPSHNLRAEAALAALGGTPPPCARIAIALLHRPLPSPIAGWDEAPDALHTLWERLDTHARVIYRDTILCDASPDFRAGLSWFLGGWELDLVERIGPYLRCRRSHRRRSCLIVRVTDGIAWSVEEDGSLYPTSWRLPRIGGDGHWEWRRARSAPPADLPGLPPIT